MQSPPPPNPYGMAPPPPPPRKSMPVWAWVLIGCGCIAPLVIVPILAAILFPVFAQARESARSASCMSNVKIMALSALMYSQDYDDLLPAASQWMDVIRPYDRTEQSFACPSIVSKQPQGYGYAYNSEASDLPLAKAPDPKTFPLIYDSDNLALNASDAVTSLPNPPRHRYNTMGYLDGHAIPLGKPPKTEERP